MVKEYLFKNENQYIDSHTVYGEIHVVGATDEVFSSMKEALSKMDLDKMAYHYTLIKESCGNGIDEVLYTYVSNKLTAESYKVIAKCENGITAADLASFIVSMEMDLKSLLSKNIRHLAINSPQLCAEVLSQLPADTIFRPSSHIRGVVPSSSLIRNEQREFGDMARRFLGENVSDNWVENFINLCNYIYNKEGDDKSIRQADRLINGLLKTLCNANEMNMVNYVRSRSEDRTFFKNFVYECLDPEKLSAEAKVTIYVRKRKKSELSHKTLGDYRLFTIKDGQEKPLKFGHELCNVYMLMYLISHVKEPERKLPIDLKKNMDEFKKLYLDNFHVFQDSAGINDVIKNFFHRTDKDGNIRSGRKGDYISAIKKQMAEQFEEYGESYIPYIMTGSTHLNIPIDKIVFDDDVKEKLMSYNFI